MQPLAWMFGARPEHLAGVDLQSGAPQTQMKASDSSPYSGPMRLGTAVRSREAFLLGSS